jgi:hypothetical protein
MNVAPLHLNWWAAGEPLAVEHEVAKLPLQFNTLRYSLFLFQFAVFSKRPE